MKKVLVLIAVVGIVYVGSNDLFAAPVGNPLKEPAKGDLLIGYEWTYVGDKDLVHQAYATTQEYRAYFHMAKFTYGLLDGLTVNGEFGVGRLKNVSQSIPHGYEVAWGGGADWNVLESLHSIWPGVPQKLPQGIDFGFSGRYMGIAGNGDNPTPVTLSTSAYHYDERWNEYQAAGWVSRDFCAFIPYGGLLLAWTHVIQKEDRNTGQITTRSLSENSDLGYFIGLDICPGKWEKLSDVRFIKDININVEFRGESETAMTAGISWVWKY